MNAWKERCRVSDHIGETNKMPPDGFYICRMVGDTGGEVTRYMRVLNGRPYLPSGHAVLPSACSAFRPLETWAICGAWPHEAAAELDALRTANAGLVERAAKLDREHECAVSVGAAEIANLRRDNDALVKRVKALEAAVGMAIRMYKDWEECQEDGISAAYSAFVQQEEKNWEAIRNVMEAKP